MFDMVSRPAVLSAALLAVWVPSQATTIEPVDINVGSVASGDGIFQVLLPRDSRAMSLSPLGKWKQFMPEV